PPSPTRSRDGRHGSASFSPGPAARSIAPEAEYNGRGTSAMVSHAGGLLPRSPPIMTAPGEFRGAHPSSPRWSRFMASNRAVHFETPANEPEPLTRFYSELFGWKFEQAPVPGMEYWLCDTGTEGPGINGAVTRKQHPTQPLMNYVDVPNMDAAIEKAT